jgi:hypothetical protein
MVLPEYLKMEIDISADSVKAFPFTMLGAESLAKEAFMAKGLCKWSPVVSLLFALLVASALGVGAQGQPPPPPGALGPSLVLHAGWNMISTPIGPASIDSLKGDCTITDGPWNWDSSEYQQASTLLPLQGYWVKVSSACTMQAIGRSQSSGQSLSLQDGWNLISAYQPWAVLNRSLTNTLGGCKLESGPWWWDGQQYQRIFPDQSLDGFKGYWVKVFGGCIINGYGQSAHHAWDDSPMPPGPPLDSGSSGFLGEILRLLGFHRTAAPAAPPMPLVLQGFHLTLTHAGQVELQMQGNGIRSSELSLYNLSGQLIAQAQGTGTTLRASAQDRDGRPLANGVYLYVVIVRGIDGQAITSNVRKLVVVH